MLFDALLKGGNVLLGGRVETVDVGVRDGLIVAIGRYLSSDRLCPVYDLRGKWVLPGFVDLWAAPGSGEEARAGGITLQCIHLRADPSLTLGETLRLAADREAHAPIDHCFSYRVAPGQVPGKEALQVAHKHGLCAVSFSLNNEGLSEHEAAALLQHAHAAGIAAFCLLENNDYRHDTPPPGMLRRKRELQLPTPAGEALVAARAIALAEVTAMPIELVGVSQSAVLARVKEAQKRGVRVRAHVFAHNLLAHQGVYLRRRGLWLRPEPPLRAKAMAQSLWPTLGASGIVFAGAPRPSGSITLLAEDSAVAPPFAATAARVLLYRAQRRKSFALARWLERLSSTPAAVLGFGGERPPIAIGALADLVVLDPAARVVVGRRPKTADEWEPFGGQRALPPPHLVMQRGRVLLDPQGVRKEVGEIARPLATRGD